MQNYVQTDETITTEQCTELQQANEFKLRGLDINPDGFKDLDI